VLTLQKTVQEQEMRLTNTENALIEMRATPLPSPLMGLVLPQAATIVSNSGPQLYAVVTGQADSTKGKSSLYDFWFTINMFGLIPTKTQQVSSLMAKNKIATPLFLTDPSNAFAVNVECEQFIALNGNGGTFLSFRNRRSVQIGDLIEALPVERRRLSELSSSSGVVTGTVKPIAQWTLDYMCTDPIVQFVIGAVRVLVTEASGGAPTVLSVHGFACVAHIIFEEQHLAVSFTLCSPLLP
jgi:hypothetical protein